MSWDLEDEKKYTAKSSFWMLADGSYSNAKRMITVVHFNVFIRKIILLKHNFHSIIIFQKRFEFLFCVSISDWE